MATRKNKKLLEPDIGGDVAGPRGAEWFKQLATMFDECLTYAKNHRGNIRWYVGKSRSLSDIQTLLRLDILRGLAGSAQSYLSLHRQFALGKRLKDKRLARLCGFYIMPLAAQHVVQMVNTGVLSEPDAICKPLRLPANRPREDEGRLRSYWKEDVLRILLKAYASSFPRRSDDPWLAAIDNVAACRLLARLTTKDGKSLPVPASSEHEEQPVALQLPGRERSVLVKMLDLQVFDFYSRKSTGEIVNLMSTDPGAPESYKEVVSSLRVKNLIETKGGRGNGCWLTSKGRAEAERLKSLKSHTSSTGSHCLPPDSPPNTP